jgi:hypothetical protein
LRGNATAARATDEPDPADVERDAFARALEDLDDDLATGKLSPEDHAVMRNELRARAAAQLLQKPAAEVAFTPPHETAAGCGQCGATPPAEARFCPQCGHPLRCTSCDHPIEAGASFCSKCGAARGAGASGA